MSSCDKDYKLEENFKTEEKFKLEENFKVEEKFKPLITTFLNNKLTLEDFIDNKKNKFIKFKPYSNNDYAIIIENEDIYKIKYYYIYINNMILSYQEKVLNKLDTDNSNYNLKLMIPDNEAINGLFDKYRLYKTTNNKLYFIIDNVYKYLSIDKLTNYLNTVENESDALTWN